MENFLGSTKPENPAKLIIFPFGRPIAGIIDLHVISMFVQVKSDLVTIENRNDSIFFENQSVDRAVTNDPRLKGEASHHWIKLLYFRNAIMKDHRTGLHNSVP